jgi:hypothetical protein
VQLRAEASTRRISPKVRTLACSNVIIAQREARNVRISFQLSMTIKLDPPGSRQGVPVSDALAGTPQPLEVVTDAGEPLLYSLIASGVVTPTDTTRRLPSWLAVSTEHHTRPDRGQPGGRVRERADVHVAEHLAVRAIEGVRGSRDSIAGEVGAGAAGSSTAVRRSQAGRNWHAAGSSASARWLVRQAAHPSHLPHREAAAAPLGGLAHR